MNHNMFDLIQNHVDKRSEKINFSQFVRMANENKEHQFTREVIWVKSYDASLILDHKGVKVKRIITLTSEDKDLIVRELTERDLKDVITHYKLQYGGDLKPIIKVVVTETPYLETDEANEKTKSSNLSNRHYVEKIPNDWRVKKPNPDFEKYPEIGEFIYPGVHTKELEEEIIHFERSDFKI